MASDARSGGPPEQPVTSEVGAPGASEGEGTGVWDPGTVWEEDGHGWETSPTSAWRGTGAEEHWVAADWGGGTGVYGSDELYATGGDYLEGNSDQGPGYGPDGEFYYDPGDGNGYGEDSYVQGYQVEAPVGPPARHRRRRRSSGPWPELVILAAVGVIAAGALLYLTTDKNPNNPSVPGEVAGGPTSAATPSTSPPSSPRTTASSLPSGSTTANPSSVIAFSVPANANWEAGLVTSWLTAEAGEGITAADVNGEVPGKVRFAYTPSDGTYWALTEFQPSLTLEQEASTASGQTLLSFFNNTQYAFSWQDGKTWTLLGDVPTGDCPGIWVPKSVLSAWSLCGLLPPRTPPGT